MKKKVAVMGAAALILLVSMQPAFASTSYLQTRIYLDGQNVTNPVHTTAIDPSSKQPTTFMPIYYAEQVLTKLGITSAWDGTTWSLTVPSSMNVNLDSPSNGASDMSISVNSTVVQTAPKVVAVDPASGQETTFIPVWYLGQVLNRMGLESSWDGTNWRLTKVIPESQQAMAQSMWSVFDGVTWAVNAHPSMDQVGISSTSAPMTAGDVATWLSEWAGQAKGTTPYFGPKQGQYVPYSLTYEASSDPYTWANINGLYQGTSLNTASSVLTAQDASQVLANLKWWLTGDEVINGVHHLHVPFYSYYLGWYDQLYVNHVSLADYQSVLAEATRVYDSITATVNGATISLNLPSTSPTANKLAWNVDDGYWEYGGWQASDNKGGKTIIVPNKTTPVFLISLETLVPSFYLEGYSVSYQNVNGAPNFTEPMSVLVGQNQEGQ